MEFNFTSARTTDITKKQYTSCIHNTSKESPNVGRMVFPSKVSTAKYWRPVSEGSTQVLKHSISFSHMFNGNLKKSTLTFHGAVGWGWERFLNIFFIVFLHTTWWLGFKWVSLAQKWIIKKLDWFHIDLNLAFFLSAENDPTCLAWADINWHQT